MSSSQPGSAPGFIKALTFLLPLILLGCAQQVAPGGGEKDIEPPRILSSEPLNESVNYDGNNIKMTFDEYLLLKGAEGQLIVSPPLKHPVDFTLRGKTVEVEWTDTLAENTTYMFQFGNGIQDLHEGNPLDSNVFVFSTGSYIDSFEIRGTVRNANDLSPAEDVWVMLYEDDVDSLPLTTLPRYFARTNKKGEYHIRYLKPGAYKIFALFSEGQGYVYDNPEELIGFETQLYNSVNPAERDTADSVEQSGPDMLLFQEMDSTQYVEENKLEENKVLVLKLHMPVKELTVTDLTGGDLSNWVEEWNAYRDSVAFWFDSTLTEDSLYLRLQTDAGYDDTLTIRKRNQRRSRGKDDSNVLKLKSSASSGKHDYYKPLLVRISEPLLKVEPERWILTLDSDTLNLDGLVKPYFRSFGIEVPWKQGKTYNLLIPDSTVSSRFGKQNDTVKWRFSTTTKEAYGQVTFRVNFEGVDHQLIWQLIEGESVVDDQIIEARSNVVYDYLKAGKYRVKVLFDENNNGFWDPGDYEYKRQPEKVIFYEGEVEVRSNWTEEIEWNYSPNIAD